MAFIESGASGKVGVAAAMSQTWFKNEPPERRMKEVVAKKRTLFPSAASGKATV